MAGVAIVKPKKKLLADSKVTQCASSTSQIHWHAPYVKFPIKVHNVFATSERRGGATPAMLNPASDDFCGVASVMICWADVPMESYRASFHNRKFGTATLMFWNGAKHDS